MAADETSAALRRAARRAVFHLLRAGLEGVKAVEAVIEELASIGSDEGSTDEEAPSRERIDIE